MKNFAYPTKAKIRQMIEAARASGIDVAGFEVTAAGSIRIIEARIPSQIENDFDRWKDRL